MQVQCQDKNCEDHWSHDPQGHFGHNKRAAERMTSSEIKERLQKNIKQRRKQAKDQQENNI